MHYINITCKKNKLERELLIPMSVNAFPLANDEMPMYWDVISYTMALSVIRVHYGCWLRPAGSRVTPTNVKTESGSNISEEQKQILLKMCT